MKMQTKSFVPFKWFGLQTNAIKRNFLAQLNVKCVIQNQNTNAVNNEYRTSIEVTTRRESVKGTEHDIIREQWCIKLKAAEFYIFAHKQDFIAFTNDPNVHGLENDPTI